MNFFKFLFVDGLTYFHIIFADWALAIMALAFGIRIILLPLQIFSYVQQKRLRTIQPEIDRLTAELKADPLRAFKEIQALKNKHGVKTWTTLIVSFAQIPVFLGMYQAISCVRNLTGASFAWIPNLSTPDAFFILPILVALMTYLQFRNKGTSAAGSPRFAEMVGMVLPIINFVFMAAMPASLVLYYATSGVFQFATDSILKNTIA